MFLYIFGISEVYPFLPNYVRFKTNWNSLKIHCMYGKSLKRRTMILTYRHAVEYDFSI